MSDPLIRVAVLTITASTVITVFALWVTNYKRADAARRLDKLKEDEPE